MKKRGFGSPYGIAGKILVFLSFAFLGRALWKLGPDAWPALSAHDGFVTLPLLIAVNTATLFLLARGWKLILDFVSPRPLPFRDLLPVFLKSNVAKYLPGNVFEFVSRNLLASRYGWSGADILFSSLLTAALSVSVFVLSGIALVAGLPPESASRLWIGRAYEQASHSSISLLGFVLIVGAGLAGLGWFWKSDRAAYLRSQARNLLSPRFITTYARFFVLNAVNLAVASFIFGATLAISRGGAPEVGTWPAIALAFLIAFLAGYLVPGAPGGLGIRESLLVLQLGPTFGEPAVLVSALIYRVVTVAGDALGYASATWLEREYGPTREGSFAGSAGTRPLRILCISTSFIRSPEDYHAHFIFEQLRSTAQAQPGMQITVLAPHAPGLSFRDEAQGIVIHRFPYFFPLSQQRLAYQSHGIFGAIRRSKLALISVPFFLGSMCLHAILLARKADLIHAQWLPTGFVALPAKWLWRIPILVSARGSDLHSVTKSERKKNLYRVLLNRLDGVLTVSRDFFRILTQELRVSVPVECLFNGVDDVKFRPRPHAEVRPALGVAIDEPLVLYVGNIIESKGVGTLLVAFREVLEKQPRARLVLAGDGPEMARFTGQARDLGISERVTFAGTVPRARIPDWMSAADLLILPSRGEGRPNVVLEAHASELPVIATAVGGTRELVEHDRTGLLFQPDDPKTLASQISMLLADPERARGLARNGHRFLETEGLNWRAHGQRLLSIYSKTLGRGAPDGT